MSKRFSWNESAEEVPYIFYSTYDSTDKEHYHLSV